MLKMSSIKDGCWRDKDGMAWTGLFGLRIGTGGELL
jgi:hypothetical protein